MPNQPKKHAKDHHRYHSVSRPLDTLIGDLPPTNDRRKRNGDADRRGGTRRRDADRAGNRQSPRGGAARAHNRIDRGRNGGLGSHMIRDYSDVIN